MAPKLGRLGADAWLLFVDELSSVLANRSWARGPGAASHVIDLGLLARGLVLYKAEDRQFSMSWKAILRYAWGSTIRILRFCAAIEDDVDDIDD